MQKPAKRVKKAKTLGIQFIKSDENNQFLVTKQGRLFVRGKNLSGELGIKTGASTNEWLPAKGLGNKKVLNLWNFEGMTFVCTEEGDLYASGYNVYGALGVGDRRSRLSFTPVLGLEGSYVVDILRDRFFIWDTLFLLTQDGKLYRKAIEQQVYQKVDELKDVDILWMKSCFGSIFVCTAGGRLWACGRNLAGCLGVGDRDEREEFVHIDVNKF